MVLFHDDLLHGGAVNRGRTCRISIELTILYRSEAACWPENWRDSGDPRQAQTVAGRRDCAQGRGACFELDLAATVTI
jgi:hypothetical protein